MAFACLLAASLSTMLKAASATRLGVRFAPSQTAGRASTTDQAEKDVPELKLGKPVERGLLEGEHQSYRVTLSAGQFVHFVIESQGADLTVTVVAPSGLPMMQLALAPGSFEPLFLVAREQGPYRIEIQLEKGSGSYRAAIDQLRAATTQDRDRALAQSALLDGERLHKEGTAESKQRAVEKYEQALSFWRLTDDRQATAKALDGLGSVHHDLGENQTAIEYLTEALPLFHGVRDRAGQARVLHNIGAVYDSLGERKMALDHYNQALTIERAIGDRTAEGATLNKVCIVYIFKGERQTALAHCNQALLLRRAAGDRAGEGGTLNNLGLIYDSLGERQRALDYYNLALSICREVGNRYGEGLTLLNMAQGHVWLGERQKALEYYNQALTLARATGNRNGEGSTLSNIGLVYDALGERQRALDYYNRALAIERAIGDRQGEGVTLNNIGEVYYALGERQKALEYYDRALSLRRAVGDRDGEAHTLGNIGAAHASLGDAQKALAHYHAVLPLERAAGDRQGEGSTLHGLGRVYHSLGERRKALDYYNQALLLQRAVGDREGETATLGNMALVERENGNLAEALAHVGAALKIIESLRTKVLGEELRTSYFSTVQSNYAFYIDVLMRLHEQHPGEGNEARALEASERARARSLLETLAEAQADIRQGVDPALLQRERGLWQLLKGKEAAQVELPNENQREGQGPVLKKEIEEILTRYEQVEEQIRAASPHYAALTQPQPLSAPEIQRQLDEDTLLLEYVLGEERSFLWAVSPDSLRSFELPKRADLEAAARRFYELLTARNRRVKFETDKQRRARLTRAETQYPEVAARLSQMLLGPAASLLKGKRLLIVSDGALEYIPFAALPEPFSAPAAGPSPGPTDSRKPSVPLVTRHEIIGLPSASALAVLRRETRERQPPSEAIAVLADPVFDREDTRVARAVRSLESRAQDSRHGTGAGREQEETETTSLRASLATDRLTRSAFEIGLGRGRELDFPRLTFTRREAQAILSAAPSGKVMMALDFQASLQTATDPALAHYRIVHFATHGLLNSEHPELSGLVLSLVDPQGRPTDGFLQLQDIYNLNLPADLVVLSACQTGLGKEIRGEGLMGLTRGFMYAGAARVIVSLWDVHDQATAQLMSRLYRQLLTRGRTPAAALRAAQISVAKQRAWHAPYYWAAFVLQGEPN